MKGVTNRKRITVPDMGTDLKVYWILADPGFGEDYFVEKVLKKHPHVFAQRNGVASIYGVEECKGNFIWTFDRLISTHGLEVPLFNTYHYEDGKPVPGGERGNCGVEGKMFGKEMELLMEKYENNVPKWMEEFAVEID